jgi:hypothetical protein
MDSEKNTRIADGLSLPPTSPGGLHDGPDGLWPGRRCQKSIAGNMPCQINVVTFAQVTIRQPDKKRTKPMILRE